MVVTTYPFQAARCVNGLVAEHVDDTEDIFVYIAKFHRFVIGDSVQTVEPLGVVWLLSASLLAEHKQRVDVVEHMREVAGFFRKHLVCNLIDFLLLFLSERTAVPIWRKLFQ